MRNQDFYNFSVLISENADKRINIWNSSRTTGKAG